MAVVDTKAAYDNEGEEKVNFIADEVIPLAPVREIKDQRLKAWLQQEGLLFLQNELYCLKYADLYSISKEEFKALSQNLDTAQKIRFREALQLFQSHYSTNTRRPNAKATSFKDMFKVILVGDCKVGKSSILNRFIKDEFEPSYEETIALIAEDSIVELPEKNVKLQICDTSGAHNFGTISKAFYRQAHGVLIVYDCTKQTSFDNVISWIEKANMQVADKAWKMLVANKCDLEDQRIISIDQGERLAVEYNMKHMECSAKTGDKVASIFKITAQYLLSAWEENKPQNASKCSCVML
eukprot:487301_1